MLRLDPVTSIIRFYDTETPGDFEEYVAVCNVYWESKDTIWIHGFHGTVTRKHLRALLRFFIDYKIKTVKAKRSPFRSLPLSRKEGEMHVIDVDELIKRFIS